MSERHYRLLRHPLVRRDLKRISDFLLDYTTRDSVASKVIRLERDISRLAERPHRGTRYDDILPNLRAVPSSDKGVISFTVDEDTQIVRILCVTWGGANWMATVGDRA